MKSNASGSINENSPAIAFPSRSEAISSDGSTIAYWDGGNRLGPAIIFLHGFATDHSVWVNQFSDSALCARYRLIAPDLRAHGQSGRTGAADALTDAKQWADDLAALIQVCAPEKKPVIVAWSFGARMLNDYLKHYGASALAGINYVAAATLAYREAIGPGHAILADLCADEQAVRTAAAERFVGEVFQVHPGNAAFGHLQDTIAEVALDHRKRMRSRALDYDQMLAELALPVLVTHGEEDSFVLPCLAIRLQQVLRNAEVSHYPGVGHAPFWEKPARFNAELTAFVQSAPSRQAALRLD
jgi:pimeloyl-ACP methyl ester carboxylesterase